MSLAFPSIILQSRLSQWPVQIQLAPINAPYFHGAKLLIAADCTAVDIHSTVHVNARNGTLGERNIRICGDVARLR